MERARNESKQLSPLDFYKDFNSLHWKKKTTWSCTDSAGKPGYSPAEERNLDLYLCISYPTKKAIQNESKSLI